MTAESLMTMKATLLRREAPIPDPYGDLTEIEDDATIYCEIQPFTRPGQDREVENSIAVNTFRVYLPPSIAVANSDALLVDGVRYEFTGQSVALRNPRTGMVLFNEVFAEVVR